MPPARFDIPIDKVIILVSKHGVADAAKHLNVSRFWIYKALKREGFKMARVVEPIAEKENA